MKLKAALADLGVHLDSCMSLSLGTDGVKDSSKLLMLALHGFDEEAEEISLFVSGGDVMATQRFTGIPKQVYDSLAVDLPVVTEVLGRKLLELGVRNLVCHQSARFVRPRMVDTGIVPNSMSFLDIGLLHKALEFWTSNLDRATSVLDLQGRIMNMRGKNLISLNKLADHYGIDPDASESPYTPVKKALTIKKIFEKQMETELPG